MKKKEVFEKNKIIHDLKYLINENNYNKIIFKTLGVFATFCLLFFVTFSLSIISISINNQFLTLLFALSITITIIGIFFTLFKLVFDIFRYKRSNK